MEWLLFIHTRNPFGSKDENRIITEAKTNKFDVVQYSSWCAVAFNPPLSSYTGLNRFWIMSATNYCDRRRQTSLLIPLFFQCVEKWCRLNLNLKMSCVWPLGHGIMLTGDGRQRETCRRMPKKKHISPRRATEFMSHDVVLICSTCQSDHSLKPSTRPAGGPGHVIAWEKLLFIEWTSNMRKFYI